MSELRMLDYNGAYKRFGIIGANREHFHQLIRLAWGYDRKCYDLSDWTRWWESFKKWRKWCLKHLIDFDNMTVAEDKHFWNIWEREQQHQEYLADRENVYAAVVQ